MSQDREVLRNVSVIKDPLNLPDPLVSMKSFSTRFPAGSDQPQVLGLFQCPSEAKTGRSRSEDDGKAPDTSSENKRKHATRAFPASLSHHLCFNYVDVLLKRFLSTGSKYRLESGSQLLPTR